MSHFRKQDCLLIIKDSPLKRSDNLTKSGRRSP